MNENLNLTELAKVLQTLETETFEIGDYAATNDLLVVTVCSTTSSTTSTTSTCS